MLFGTIRSGPQIIEWFIENKKPKNCDSKGVSKEKIALKDSEYEDVSSDENDVIGTVDLISFSEFLEWVTVLTDHGQTESCQSF